MLVLKLVGVFLLYVHLVNSQCIAPNCVSFCAVRSTPLDEAAHTIPFENLTINDGNSFDLDTSTFTAPQTGLYWIHFSIGMEPDTVIDVRLQGDLRTPNIPRPHTAFNETPSVTSRSELVQLEANTELWLSSDSTLYSDDGIQTSFSGFLLNNIVDPLVAFAVGCTRHVIQAKIVDHIPYDTVYIDTRGAWSTLTHEYVVPVSGIYVLAVHLGAYPNDYSALDLYFNDVRQMVVIKYDPTHIASDIVSKTLISPLIQGDRVYTHIHNDDQSLYSDIRYQTSIIGFMYTPYRAQPISWSVARDGAPVVGPVDPVEFDVIFLNQGAGYDGANSRFVAPVPGVYYINFGTGVYLERVLMELVYNGETIANIHHESLSETNNHCSLSRAIILRLEQGDELHIRVPEEYELYSRGVSGYRHIMFSGIRLYA